MRTFSLRTSLALMVAAAALLSFTVVATVILVVRLPQVEQRAREQAQSMALESNRLLDNYMESVEQQIEPLVHALRSRRTPAEVQLLLDAIVGIGTTFDSLVLVGPDGRVEAYGLPRSRVVVAGFSMRGLDLSANRLYREQKARQKDGSTRPLWSDSYLSVLSGQMTVGVAIPAGGRMVIGELSQARLLKLMNSIGYTDEAVVLVTDRTGKLLASSAVQPLTVKDFGGYASFKALVQRQSLPLYEEVNGQRQMVGGVVSPRLGWVIASLMPAGWALYSYRLTVLIVVIGYIGSLLISLALAPLWARRLTQPFRVLAGQAHRIARGDPPAPAGDVGPIAEFRQLATDLDGMAQAIQAREAAMQRSEARLKATLESAPSVAIQWFDVHGRVLYWNRASADLYGYSADEAVGRRITEYSLMYGDAAQAQSFVQLLAEMERSGQPYGPAEYELVHKNGRPVTVLATTFPLPGGDGDTVFVCMDVDITQRKLAEEALRTHELKLDAIFNASPAPMSVSDVRDGYRMVGVNRAWELLFARPRDTVLGRNGTELGYWVEAEDRTRFLTLVETQGRVHDFEAWCLDGQGRAILCQISAQVTEIGAERLLLMMTVDITDRRRIERELQQLNAELEQRVEMRTEELRLSNQRLESTVHHLRLAQAQLVEAEKLAALGNLVAGVAHELNTPIGNGLMALSTLDERLKAFRRIAREEMRYSDLEHFVESVDTACAISQRNLQRAATLVTSFKQVAVDQTSSQRRRFELLEVVNEVLLTLQPTLRKTPHRVEVRVPPGLTLDSYPGALGQVLTNLIANAVMHAFGARPTGTITIDARALSGQELLFSVSDDGEGIPEALQKKIFEPFFTTKLGQGGTGLGLHIVFNAVVRVLGGQVSLRSAPGQGSSFELRIPRVAPSTETAPAAD